MKNLKELNEKAMQEHIAEIKAAPAGSEILKENQHLLKASSTWAGGGELSLAGFIWWKAHCILALTDLSTGVKAVVFSASGTGFMIGAIESLLVGAFIVNPKEIPKGHCHFKIVTAAVEGGICTLFLYSTKGKFYGNFTGPAEGLAAGTMSGTGELIVT